MPLLPIQTLHHEKQSTTCVFLGCGQSIDRLTEGQLKWMEDKDIWAVNNFAYHPFIIPNFYHVEAKWYDYYILQKRLTEKASLYKHTNFIFPQSKTIRMKNSKTEYLSNIVTFPAKKYGYQMLSRDRKRTHAQFNCDYQIKDKLTKSYDMSLTLIFELIYRMGYTKIVLFGVDLSNSLYFWTEHPEWGEVHHRTNKEHEGKNPNEPHATYRIKDFLIDFRIRRMSMYGKSMVVGHKDTALYPEIPFEEIP